MFIFIYIIVLVSTSGLSIFVANKFKEIIFKRRFIAIFIASSIYIVSIISIVIGFIKLENGNFNNVFWILILLFTGLYIGFSVVYGSIRSKILNDRYKKQSKYFD